MGKNTGISNLKGKRYVSSVGRELLKYGAKAHRLCENRMVNKKFKLVERVVSGHSLSSDPQALRWLLVETAPGPNHFLNFFSYGGILNNSQRALDLMTFASPGVSLIVGSSPRRNRPSGSLHGLNRALSQKSFSSFTQPEVALCDTKE